MSMKLLSSDASPFGRKVIIVATELNMLDRFERVTASASPIIRNEQVRAHNPLGQIPTLLLDDGRAIFDSGVICEYFNHLGRGNLYGNSDTRWHLLTEEALGDGLMEAAFLVRYEIGMRPPELQWRDWIDGQMSKVHDALARIEAMAQSLGGRIDIGTITLACALSYLNWRFPDLGWQTSYPNAANWYAPMAKRWGLN